MEFFNRNKTIILISLIVAIILAISTAFFFSQNISNPSPTSSPFSTPTLSPLATGNSPTPTIKLTSPPTSTSVLPSSSKPSPTGSLQPGEVSQYQDQNLTPISVYTDYLFQHPDVAIHGAQYIEKSSYRLAITGLVNYPLNYTYDEIVNNFNSTLDVATLPCVEGWSVTLLWQGVPISDILAHSGIGPKATTLIFLASDGYSTSLPLDYVKQNNISIAYKMNNITLTAQTGWPFFLVAKNQYGYKWIEWITEINISNNSNYLGYWESRGYPNNATVSNSINANKPLFSAPTLIPVIAVSIAALAVIGAILVSRGKRKKNRICITVKTVFQYLDRRSLLSSSSRQGQLAHNHCSQQFP